MAIDEVAAYVGKRKNKKKQTRKGMATFQGRLQNKNMSTTLWNGKLNSLYQIYR